MGGICHRRLLRILLLAAFRLCEEHHAISEARPNHRPTEVFELSELCHDHHEGERPTALLCWLSDFLCPHRPTCHDHSDCAGLHQKELVISWVVRCCVPGASHCFPLGWPVRTGKQGR